jgi:signal transduction histidine kinase
MGWLLLLRDLTEEREATRLLEEMTHMLVHDLRSPLTALMGTVEMLGTVIADGDEAEELLSLADQGTNRMLLIIDALLDISKLESGQMPVHREHVAPETLLHGVAAQIAPLASAAQVTLEVDAGSDLPSLWVDPELIVRVLNNLLDNAFKFTPDGGRIKLWARLDTSTTPATALVGITDDGPGIPPEDQTLLFEKFQQVAATKGRRSGTGLGLPFCKLAVEAHGGQIWVESEVGKGTTFLARLPIAE